VKSVSFLLLLLCVWCACQSGAQESKFSPAPLNAPLRPLENAPKNAVPVVHVFVALCDNVNQGIVPVSATLGNGDDPQRNLYWGAAFGVKTFFTKNKDWRPIESKTPSNKSASVVLERSIFKHRTRDVFLVAEAYRGRYIQQATQDFLEAAAGAPGESIEVTVDGKKFELHAGGSASLLAYVGHDGLMDFQLASFPTKRDEEKRDAIILACASKNFFAEPLKATGARPLVWTTNLMAPEAYILSAAIDGWLIHETDEQIRVRAAKAYSQYQRIGLKSASGLFATGW
jgi:hypothetical protein